MKTAICTHVADAAKYFGENVELVKRPKSFSIVMSDMRVLMNAGLL